MQILGERLHTVAAANTCNPLWFQYAETYVNLPGIHTYGRACESTHHVDSDDMVFAVQK